MIMKKLKLIFTILLVSLVTLTHGQTLEARDPETIGLSPERLNVIDQVITGYIDRNEIPGVVALIARKGEIGYLKSFGMRDIENNQAMTNDAIFRIASMTKAITTVGIMILYEQGLFKLDDPISHYLPEFQNMKTMAGDSIKQEITFRHLLNHTSGLSYAFMGPQQTFDLYTQNRIYNGLGKTEGTIGENVKRLTALPLMFQPGEKFQYGLSADVLGYLIEIISGLPLDEFFNLNIFLPLEMSDTYFYLPTEKENRLAILHSYSENQLKRTIGEAKSGLLKYSDYSTYASNRKYFSGGGGLLSTASDYYNFLTMIFNYGNFKNQQIISRKTVELMTSNQTGDLFSFEKGAGFGFGFAISNGPSETGMIESAGTYSWSGIFTSHFWVDPEEQFVGIILTQTQPLNWDFVRKFKTLAYQAIND